MKLSLICMVCMALALIALVLPTPASARSVGGRRRFRLNSASRRGRTFGAAGGNGNAGKSADAAGGEGDEEELEHPWCDHKKNIAGFLTFKSLMLKCKDLGYTNDNFGLYRGLPFDPEEEEEAKK